LLSPSISQYHLERSFIPNSPVPFIPLPPPFNSFGASSLNSVSLYLFLSRFNHTLK
jgi:hypothetical protein